MLTGRRANPGIADLCVPPPDIDHRMTNCEHTPYGQSMVAGQVPRAARQVCRSRNRETDRHGAIQAAKARVTKRSAEGGAGRRFLGRHEGCHGVRTRGQEEGRDLTTSAGSLLLLPASSGYPDAASRLYG